MGVKIQSAFATSLGARVDFIRFFGFQLMEMAAVQFLICDALLIKFRSVNIMEKY
jgi:hypothetical protein